MRVLHIINSLDIGGAEKLLVDILPMLQKKKGLVVEVLLLGDSDTFLRRTLTNSGVCIHPTSTGNVYSVKKIFEIIPFLKKYEICHIHLFPSLYWTAIAKLISFSNTKLIFTEHSTSNRRWKSKLFRIFDFFIYRQYAAIICITHQVKFALENNVRQISSKSFVIENGIDLQKYTNAKGYKRREINEKLLQEDKLVIQISAFRKEKDQDTLIRALCHLPQNYRIILVGEGERKIICKMLATELNVADRVFFLGTRSDVPNLLKTCDIAVQSSHWEGFGLAAVESMASGLPILASDVPGLADVIGNNDFLFNKGNEKELAAKILKLTSNHQIYEEAKNYCINRAIEFDINFAVKKIIELYNKILKR